MDTHLSATPPAPPLTVLRAYLLGRVPFEATLAWQKRLVFEVSGDPTQAHLILCEHARLITIGRDGSQDDVAYEPAELTARGWSVRWVNRGGGATVHSPGQLVAYSVFPILAHTLTLRGYIDRLRQCVAAMLRSWHLPSEQRPGEASVRVGGRAIAQVGVAVRDQVAYFGLIVNVQPDLDPFRRVRCGPSGEPPMTSMQRELRSAVRMSSVRQCFLDQYTQTFAIARYSLIHSSPVLTTKAASDAVVTHPH